jgi:hypothetical protein
MKKKSKDGLEEEEISYLEDLSEEDWNDIRRIARAIYDEGTFEKNQFKCAVAAFNEWLARLDIAFCVGKKPKITVH